MYKMGQKTGDSDTYILEIYRQSLLRFCAVWWRKRCQNWHSTYNRKMYSHKRKVNNISD